jgi:SAM-dependent methyltransferase
MAAQVRLSQKLTVPVSIASSVRSRRHASVTLPFQPMSRVPSPLSGDYMEHRPCPICGGERQRSLFQYDDFQFYTDAAFSKRVPIRQVQCRDCFGVFMNPVFTAKGFAILFAEAGASYGSTSGRQAEQLEWLKARGLLEPGTRLLDIGCYEGSFIGKLPAGIKGVGVDIDEPAIERARQRVGGNSAHQFICADFERFEINGDVDVITMFHVLEHLPRPGAVLKRLAALASPKTRLLVEVPIFENVIYGDICGFITVQHLTHFSLASLRNLLRESGWRQVSVQSMEGYNGFRIIAEPAAQCRFEGAPDDIGLTLSYLSKWYGAVAGVEARLQRVSAPRCVLRGGGLQTEYLMQLTSLFGGTRQFLIADQDPLKQGKNWRGIPIVGTDRLTSVDWRDTQLVLSSYSHQDAMRDEALAHGLSSDTVIPLYDQISRY